MLLTIFTNRYFLFQSYKKIEKFCVIIFFENFIILRTWVSYRILKNPYVESWRKMDFG